MVWSSVVAQMSVSDTTLYVTCIYIANNHVYMHALRKFRSKNFKTKCAEILPIEDGPFIVALDETLKDMVSNKYPSSVFR